MEHLQPLLTIITSISVGIFCIILANRLKLPSILFLLIAGICLGPYGLNIIQPAVFKNEFPQYITLLVVLILFEGGTSLKFKQLQEISKPLRQLLSVGMLITLTVSSLGAHVILGMPWIKAVLFGSILIVTGPTVVQPILQRIRVKEKVHNLLKWESILIDPLGVITAIVLSEILLVDTIGPLQGIGLFSSRIVLGVFLGYIASKILYHCFTKPSLLFFESEELSGIFVLAINLLFYGISESIISESGLITVTTAGILFGNMKLPNLETILRFKKQLTLIALSVIFILLSAYIPLPKFHGIIKEGSLFLLFLVFIVRPLSVLLSTFNEKSITSQERLFLAFFAPRGIVSAVLASLLTILFEKNDLIGQGTFLPLAFFIIIGSILFYTITGKFTATVLNLVEGKGKGILIIGITPITINLAKILKNFGSIVSFIDTNPELCTEIESKGFPAYHGSGIDKGFIESLDLKGIDQMIAATTNHEANTLSCQLMASYLGKKSVFRLWNKTDSWDKHVSSKNEDWGRPLILQHDLLEHEISDIDNIITKTKLNKSTPITKDSFNQNNSTFPLFAMHKNQLIFMCPNTHLPMECELISLNKKKQ